MNNRYMCLFQWDGEGDGREVQKEGDVEVHMAGSC